jgi:hypothetical protein
MYGMDQGVTKRCRLFWLTNSTLVYEPNAGEGGDCGVSANEDSCAHGAQINFGDPTPYLTYERKPSSSFKRPWENWEQGWPLETT